MVRGGGGLAALRGLTYALLACAILGGAWVRFGADIAAVLPGLAPPGAPGSEAAGPATAGLVELALVPAAQNEAAVAEMGLPAADAGLLNAALRRGDLRLVRMPLMDAGLSTGDAGHTVQLSAGGYTTFVHLGRAPVAVPLPIGPVGEVAFKTWNTDGVRIGTIGLTGPVRLPALAPGQELDVGVIAE